MKWKEIENTDGLYLISDTGKVFSVRSERIIKNQQQSNGYWRVELNFNGVPKRYFIHRLVASAFVPNPNNYPIVNHKDENPSNNNAENLEWCTQEYNCNYGNRNKKIQDNRKPTPSGADNSQSIHVYQFDLKGNLIAEYGSCGEAERITGYPRHCISRAVCGHFLTYKGYYWSCENKFEMRESNASNQRFRHGAILKCDMDGNILKRYERSKDLINDGYRQISVNRCCRGERKSYKGFTWKHERKE